jgi:four helix bundle protein
MENKTNNFQGLVVWQKSMDLAQIVHEISRKFPAEERFGLTLQIRRAGTSLPSNIAEGAGRNSKKEFSQFLSIALGSSFEVQTQLMLARRFEYITEQELESVSALLVEIQKMISGLKRSLMNKISLVLSLLLMF